MSSSYNPPTPPNVSDAKVFLEHAQRMSTPVVPEDADVIGLPVMLTPPGWRIEQVPGWQERHPHRVQQAIHFHTAESFSRYVSTFKNADSVILADLSQSPGLFIAIIDYHKPNPGDDPTPNWGHHRAYFAPKPTVEWQRWQDVDRKKMSQQEFAIFLEENTPAVVSPPGADLLAIVNTLEINGAVSFQSAQRLSSGAVSFQLVNEQKAKSGAMEVPTEFSLRLPLFEGEAPSPITARLRWRLNGGQLSLWFELVNPHIAITDALEVISARIQVGTAINPYRGTSPG